ncbi:MAG: hypothetical protein QW076_00285 [Candidatus Anstonellales archaeon]
MPFKSKAQIRKFFALEKKGKISDETLQEWIASTPDIKHLPERVGRKKKTKK